MKKWFDSLSSRAKILLLLLSGSLLTAFTLVVPAIGFLEWISMVPIVMGAVMLCSDEKTSLWKSYRYGFLAVYVYYFVIYHWIVHLYPLDFVGMDNASSVAVVLAGWFGLPLLQALVGGLVFLVFRLTYRCGALKRTPLLSPLCFAALWTVFEWSSTIGWTGVPWGRLCIGQATLLPMLQISSVFGSYAVSFLLLTVNGLLAFAILCHAKRVLCISLASGLLFGNLLFGLIAQNRNFRTETSVKAAVIQGNINSHDKWGTNGVQKMMDIYTELTEKAVAEGAKLVVWPETTLPFELNESGYMIRELSELAKKNEIYLMVGALYYDEEQERSYNSLYMILPNGAFSEERYDKQHLVPFGEYVPMRKVITTVIPPLGELSALEDDILPGKGSALINSEWGKIGSLICFDSIYEILSLNSVRDGAELMVISSNDSWFFDSAAVYQHQVQAQLRAIETGRYFLRSANTGISTILSPNGKILTWLDPLTTGYSVCEVSFRQNRTVYSVIGNAFVYACMAFATALPVSELVIRKTGKGKRMVDESKKTC
jgi:apolipoprotein N-acyltransferase